MRISAPRICTILPVQTTRSPSPLSLYSLLPRCRGCYPSRPNSRRNQRNHSQAISRRCPPCRCHGNYAVSSQRDIQRKTASMADVSLASHPHPSHLPSARNGAAAQRDRLSLLAALRWPATAAPTSSMECGCGLQRATKQRQELACWYRAH